MLKADHLIRRETTISGMDTVKSRKKELRTKAKDPDLLRHCEHLWTTFDEFRRQRKRGNRFYDGDQWGDLIEVNGEVMTYRQYLTQTGNVVIQTNQIKNRVDTITGLRVKERTDPVCEAIDKDEQPYGELVTEGVQANSDRNQVPELEIKWIKDLCNGGLCASYESYDDCSGPSRRLDSWTQYVNPNRIFFDADGVDPRYWDLSTIGCIRYATKEEICSRFVKSPSDYDVLQSIYPNQFTPFKTERATSLEEKMDDGSLVFMDTTDPERCYFCEVWTKESKPKIRLHDLNEGSEEIIDADDQQYRKLVKMENENRRALAKSQGIPDEDVPYIIGDGFGNDDGERNGFFMDTYWYCRFLAPDGTILWEGESPYADRQHPFSLCIFSYIDGRIIGYNHDAIDHQMAINRAWITNEWLTRAQAKGVTVVPKSIVPKDVSFKEFAKSWTAIDDVVFIDVKPGMEGMMPKVFYGAAQNYDASRLIQTIKDLMDSGSPVNGALQGKDPGRSTSGTLYAQMATNASTPVAAFMEQFRNFIRQMLYKKMQNIVMFYDADRWAKIVGKIDSLTDFSVINLNNVGEIQYDLRLMESANSLQAREMQEADLINLLTIGVINGDEYTKLSRKSYIQKLRQMREARQAEADAAQEAGIPVETVPEAAPQTEAPANVLESLPAGVSTS